MDQNDRFFYPILTQKTAYFSFSPFNFAAFFSKKKFTEIPDHLRFEIMDFLETLK